MYNVHTCIGVKYEHFNRYLVCLLIICAVTGVFCTMSLNKIDKLATL